MDQVQIIILAAGRSTRMKSEEPKALALYKGKYFLQHILDIAAGLGLINKPIIVVGYKKEKVVETFGPDYIYAEQKEQKGTGHAVASAVHLLKKDASITLILFTDQIAISHETIQKILTTHLEKKPILTMATIVVPDYKDWRVSMNHFGRIIRDTAGEVSKIVEFKDASEEERLVKEVNPSLYAFDTNWLIENIDKLKNENAQGEYYLTDLIMMAHDQKKKIEIVPITDIREGIHPNSKEELEILERLSVE
ncbi:MAG: NTP transferase domain-containing protein [Patescibacteria group bacterium]